MARVARFGASMALATGMLLAIGWSTALVVGVPYLDLEAMVRTHGALNLAAVLVAAWALAGKVRPLAVTARPVMPTLGARLALGIGAIVAARPTLDGRCDRFDPDCCRRLGRNRPYYDRRGRGTGNVRPLARPVGFGRGARAVPGSRDGDRDLGVPRGHGPARPAVGVADTPAHPRQVGHRRRRITSPD